MKPTLILVASLLATSAFAAPAQLQYRPGSEAQVVRLQSDPERFPRMMAEAKAYAEARRANAIADVRAVGLMVFPAAGSVPGSAGTFFRSDVTLINYDSASQDVIFYWMANNSTSRDLPALRVTLAPSTVYTFEDFVGTQFELQGLGAMYAIPVNGDTTDLNASVDGFSRIWTNQPNATGTVSQPFPATDPFSFYILRSAAILGLRHDPSYRTNFGLLNLDDEPHRFRVEFIGSKGLTNQIELTLQPQTMTQQGIPAGDYGHLIIRVSSDDTEAWWLTYASSTDNITGDGWVSVGSGILTPAELDAIER
ncbi:MAG TPA: hypothetical protein VGF48_15580 [Thermoanaerobaculia bacterium]|jgi:hypothetical protein